MVRPRKGSPCSEPYLTAPSLELIPYSVTIARAILVACSMSDTAPVVGSRDNRSPGGPPREHQSLGGAPPHRKPRLRDHPGAGAQALVFLRHGSRVPAGTSAGQ